MKTVLALLVSFAAMSFAQDNDPGAMQQQEQMSKRRLESVTWDLNSHKLVWVVQNGSEVGGKFVASSTDKYEISPDKAVMEFADQKRGFTEQEATSLHHLLDVLSLYCAESVVWWDQGNGSPVDSTPNAKPASPRKQPENSEPQPKKVIKPAARPDSGTQVAGITAR